APADGAAVDTGITETGSGTGINHGALQLVYIAGVNIHGLTTITAATGDVKIASNVKIKASADATGGPDKGDWTSGVPYLKGDVVTDNDKRYAAQYDVTSTTAPSSDLVNWKDAKSSDSSVSVAQVYATSTSQLSGTSLINASNGNASITANLKTEVETTADSSASGSGAGIAVSVLTTDTEAFVDSTAGTPITAQDLNIAADTENSAATTGKSSPKGADAAGGNDTSANKPGDRLTPGTDNGYNADSAAKANDKSKTADGKTAGGQTTDGNQNLAAALAVTVVVETTKAYIAPNDQGSIHTINLTSGTAKVHAGSKNTTSAEADAGNVKFSPEAPTFTGALTTGGLLEGKKSYFYKITALFKADAATTAAITITPGFQVLDLGILLVASTSGFGAKGVLMVAGVTQACDYTQVDATTLAVSNCSGLAIDGAAVTQVEESLPGPENEAKIPDGTSTNQVTVNWGAVANAVGYRIYRTQETGKEKLIDSVGAVTSYIDKNLVTPAGDPPTEDASSGVGIAVAVNVDIITTDAYLAGNLRLVADGGVTVEAQGPGSGNSSFTSHATSGAGGSSVGVAGSIAVTVLTSNTTALVKTPAPVAVTGDVTLTSKSNNSSGAIADAKQSSDGKTSGIGASVSVNVVNDTTRAGLADGSVLTGAKNLKLTAAGTDAMNTKADGGASAGSGSFAISAQVAIAISNVTTSASVGTGSDLTLTGALTAHATQSASTTTTASGSTTGGNAGIGLSLALLVANHLVDSRLHRNLAASTAATFGADGASANDTESKASSAGAPEKTGTGDSDNSTDGSGKDLNGKADGNLDLGNSTSKEATKSSDNPSGSDSGSSSTPKAKSGESSG
ncbi:MAG TPA: hypothetical protein VIL94_06075, partial [Acidothermaceae bacterium]